MSDYCPDCGTKLVDFLEGSSMGQRCPSCGWSLVTTFTPPILEDENAYTISILADNETSPRILKAVSRIMGCNYIAAKELILEAPLELFTGQAPDVLERKLKLESAGVLIGITPEFPYNQDGQPMADNTSDESFTRERRDGELRI